MKSQLSSSVEVTPLREFFEAKCANRSEVARRMGVSGTHLNFLVDGTRALLSKHVDSLASIYGEEVREVAERHIEFTKEKK